MYKNWENNDKIWKYLQICKILENFMCVLLFISSIENLFLKTLQMC